MKHSLSASPLNNQCSDSTSTQPRLNTDDTIIIKAKQILNREVNAQNTSSLKVVYFK